MIRLRRAGAGVFVVGIVLAAGCDSAGPQVGNVTHERGGRSGGTGTFVQPMAAPGPAPAEPAGRHARLPMGLEGAPIAGGGRIGGGAQAAPPPPTEAPTNVLENALRMQFGTPTDCISEATRPTLAGTLSLTVTVRVMPSGRVTSAIVTGRGLSSEDLTCMRERAEQIHLPGPVEDAPRTVMATVSYEVSSTPPVVAPPTIPPEGEGRPPGFVPPSSTLPIPQ